MISDRERVSAMTRTTSQQQDRSMCSHAPAQDSAYEVRITTKLLVIPWAIIVFNICKSCTGFGLAARLLDVCESKTLEESVCRPKQIQY